MKLAIFRNKMYEINLFNNNYSREERSYFAVFL